LISKHRAGGRNFKQGVVFAVEEFYQKITNRVISEARIGWLCADSFDKYFTAGKPFSEMPKNERHLSIKKSLVSKNEKYVLQLNSSQILRDLNSEKSMREKYNYLKKLVKSDNVNIVNDSFKEEAEADLGHAIEKTFDCENLNLVIIGGGACGLFLATNIKSLFGDKANVLVLDNRSRYSNTRESFKREWLTHIPASFFRIGKRPDILSLLECFGADGLIGIPINMLETILQFACKDQGVKFHFSDIFDYSLLNNNIIDLVFDVTGGRLKECSYSDSKSADLIVNIPKVNINLDDAGVKQLRNIPGVGEDDVNVALKLLGDFHEPRIENSRVLVHMVKLTGIPIDLMGPLLEAVAELNSQNLFYVWRGALRDEINEGLILINLLDKESGFLTSIIEGPITLKSLLNHSPNISDQLNENIMLILQMLVGMDAYDAIMIEQPFKYCPYVNLNAGSGLLSGKKVFAVGDSLFCGNPKAGNGLGSHLPIINDLVEEMAK
tara:strand:- start:3553 stop:5037 length:1485 start_codon:yes stop_codon:yes gene_type:complete